MSFSLSSSYWYIHINFKLNWYKINHYIQTGNKATWYISDFQVIQMQNNKQNCNTIIVIATIVIQSDSNWTEFGRKKKLIKARDNFNKHKPENDQKAV